MGLWGAVAPAVYDPIVWLGEKRGMADLRRRWLARAQGRVLEVGAGTGLNLAWYPPSVSDLVVTEPDPGMAGRLSARTASTPTRAEVVLAPADRLPFPDHSFDTVVATLVLCTVPDQLAALDEIRRVLRPTGGLVFVEHVRADHPRLARWQDRVLPLWKPFALGCECNRDTLAVLHTSGWTLTELERFRWRGMPPVVHPVVAGRAAPPAA